MDLLDHAILEKERVIMAMELQSFLERDGPDILQQALCYLEAAIHRLRCVSVDHDSEGTPILMDRASMVFMESSERELVGSLRLSEGQINDLDVNIRLPRYSKGSNLHFSIAHKTTYLVRQIQDAMHNAELSSDLIVKLCESVSQGAAEAGAAMDFERLTGQARGLIEACRDAGGILHKTEGHLFEWKSRTLPAMPQNWLRMDPPLPTDLILQLFMDGGQMVLRLFNIQAHSKAPAGKSLAVHGTPVAKLKGTVMQHKTRWLEVLDVVEARTDVPEIRRALQDIRTARNLLDSIIDCAESLCSSASHEVGRKPIEAPQVVPQNMPAYPPQPGSLPGASESQLKEPPASPGSFIKVPSTDVSTM